MNGKCELCEREPIKLTKHHLIPITRHSNKKTKRETNHHERHTIAWICRSCHDQIHVLIETDLSTGKVYPTAIIYRHSDGYPKGAGKDLFKFITRCKKLADSRLTDPSYLAARYMVFLGEMFATNYAFQDSKGKLHKHAVDRKNPNEKFKYVTIPKKNRLDFISCGVVSADPYDIEYRYVVDCGKIDPNTKRPEVKCYKVSIDDDGNDTYREEVPIPGCTKVQPVVESWVTISTVPSRTSRSKTYNIERNSTTMALRCSCPDYKYRGHKVGPCKHMLSLPVAARFMVL